MSLISSTPIFPKILELVDSNKKRWNDNSFDVITGCIPFGLYDAVYKEGDKNLLSKCKTLSLHFSNRKDLILAAFSVAWIVAEIVRNAGALDGQRDLYLSDQSIIVRLILLLKNIEDSIEKNESMPDRFSVRLQHVISKVTKDISIEEFVGITGSSGKPTEIISTAVFCFLKSPDDSSVVHHAATMGGESSLIAGICGALVGAYAGVGFLPEGDRIGIENYAKITEAAIRLSAFLKKT
jgi:ADP-ribosylglycohydrolase